MFLLRRVEDRPAIVSGRRTQVWSHARSAAAVLVLLATTVHLAGDDGGRPVRSLLPVVGLVLVASPLLVAEFARMRRVTVLVVAGLAAGPVLAWMLAPYRAGAARTLLVASLMALAFLAARYLWRQPWGPVVLGATLAVTFGRAWLDAFFAWWGAGMGGGDPTWLALSWHNQSGALMAVAAVAALAVALAGPVRAQPPAVVLAGATAAGTWLSGSRGAVLAAGVGVVVVVLGARRHDLKHLVAATATAAVLAVGVTVGLLALAPGGEGQPLTTRDEAADQNLRARVGHATAAVRMAAAYPVTGTGPGSYRWASRSVYGDDVNLTASAHNEYLEALGETGLLGGLPVVIAALALAGLALRVVRDPDGDDPLRGGGVLAAAGAVAVLGIHAGADFDWDYPLLAVLLAIGGGVLHAALREATPDEPAGVRAATDLPRSGRARVVAGGMAVVVATAGALVIGVLSTSASPAPWDLEAGLSATAAALRDGDTDAADRALDGVERWNRGSTSLPVLRAVTAVEAGRGTAEEVVAAVDPRVTPTGDQLMAAARLTAHGETAAAATILDEIAEVLDGRRSWGVRDPVASVAVERLLIAHSGGGCVAAEARFADLSPWLDEHGVPADVVAEIADLPCDLPAAG